MAKLDRIRFARLTSYISRLTNCILTEGTIVHIDEICTFDEPKFIQRIKDALGTEENNEALIEVARNAHKAEQELAAIKRQQND